jgi:hypothetical protein
LPQNELFRDRAGLAAIDGSPRTEPVRPSHKLKRFHTFLGAPLSAMPCASYHRLAPLRANAVTPLMEPGALLAFGPYLLDTATRTPSRDGDEVVLGRQHLASSRRSPPGPEK